MEIVDYLKYLFTLFDVLIVNEDLETHPYQHPTSNMSELLVIISMHELSKC